MRPERRGEPARAGALRRGIQLIRHEWWARVAALVAMLTVVGLLPVPWLVAKTPNPPGMAWRLDGRLQFNGQAIDPPGSWVGLTAGRPPLLVEVVYSWLDPATEPPRNMTKGSRFSSPAMAEPAAIAIGLIEAGIAVDVTTLVEARDPLIGGLPSHTAISQVNGRAIATRDDWSYVIEGLGPRNEIVTSGGQVVVFEGDTFPYGRVDLMQSPTDLSVSLAGWGSLIPDSWYRNLSLGRSHGLLLALAAYSDAGDVDLAGGRIVAATGIIRGDGSVGRIGGLAAKAKAADRAGVDVLLYPRDQECQKMEILGSLGRTTMQMVGVASLSEAITALRGEPPAPGREIVCAA